MNLPPDLQARLHALYADGSKHAVYQNIPEFVRDALGYTEPIDANWRSDTPRYRYLAERLALPDGTRLADVGANTGYFALNFARARPGVQVTAFEPNDSHRRFIAEIADAFHLPNVAVKADAWTLGHLDALGRFDVVLCLNIVHHAGFDFDRELPDTNAAFLAYARDYLRKLRDRGGVLCFQMGSNRGGDKQRPLFPSSDDVQRLTSTGELLRAAGWRIEHVGVAGRGPAGVAYSDLPTPLLEAVRRGEFPSDALAAYYRAANLAQFPGEFYRRPLLICRRDESLTS